jgi:hypothetical protein
MNGCYRRVAADYGRIVIWQVLPHTSRSCLSSGATKPCFPKSSRLSGDDPLRSCFRRITPPGLVICGIERRKNTMMKFRLEGSARRNIAGCVTAGGPFLVQYSARLRSRWYNRFAVPL